MNTSNQTKTGNVKFLFAHPAHFLALGLGSGLSPWAPGTFGSLFAWLTFLSLQIILPSDLFLGLVIVCFFLGIYLCQITGRHLGVHDAGCIVWDEIVAVWLVLLFCSPQWQWQLLAVVLFRFFDILKPFPVGWADKRLSGGVGVMVDDLLAAVYVIIILYLLQ